MSNRGLRRGRCAAAGSTGTTLSATNVGTAMSYPDEFNVSQPLTGLAAGDGLLVVPAGGTANAYTIVPEPAAAGLLLAAGSVATLAGRQRRRQRRDK